MRNLPRLSLAELGTLWKAKVGGHSLRQFNTSCNAPSWHAGGSVQHPQGTDIRTSLASEAHDAVHKPAPDKAGCVRAPSNTSERLAASPCRACFHWCEQQGMIMFFDGCCSGAAVRNGRASRRRPDHAASSRTKVLSLLRGPSTSLGLSRRSPRAQPSNPKEEPQCGR